MRYRYLPIFPRSTFLSNFASKRHGMKFIDHIQDRIAVRRGKNNDYFLFSEKFLLFFFAFVNTHFCIECIDYGEVSKMGVVLNL